MLVSQSLIERVSTIPRKARRDGDAVCALRSRPSVRRAYQLAPHPFTALAFTDDKRAQYGDGPIGMYGGHDVGCREAHRSVPHVGDEHRYA